MDKNMKFQVNGMTCASCVNHVEKAIKKVEGVTNVSVNLATETATIQYDEKHFNPENAINSVKQIGYTLVMD
jgi:Cu+-exporting ATPase